MIGTKKTIRLGPRLRPVPCDSSGAGGSLLRQIRRDLGLLPPPLLLHACLPDVFAASWAVLRETVLVDGAMTRSTKECVAVAISRTNHCPYCVEAHSVALHSLGQGPLLRRLLAGREVPERLAALLAWAEASRDAGAEILRRPPFPPEARAEALGTALAFHYINRMVTALLPDSVLPVPAGPLRRPLLALAGRIVAAPRDRHLAGGESLVFLAPGGGTREPAWAAGSPAIARAFAALDQATEAALSPHLDCELRRDLIDRLAAWQGEQPPLGGAWIADALGDWQAGDAAIGRLALLAALCPHRITESELEGFRARHPGDQPLVATLAWASYQACRRISGWLAESALRGNRPSASSAR